MAKSAIKAGEGYVELSTRQEALEKGLQAAAQKLQSWAQGIMAMGAAITAAGVAITAPFLKGLEVFSGFGTEAVATMRMTGMAFGEMDELMDGMRVGAEEMVPAVAKMSAAIGDAVTGSREAVETFDALGISIADLQRMSQGERMMAIADGLNGIADAGRRIQLQRQIFGRGGLSLNLEGGAAGIRARAARQDEVEGVQTDADVAIARRYNEAMREMKLAITGVWFALGRAAAPAMTEFAKLVTDVVIRVRVFITENRHLLDVIFRVADKLIMVGAAVGALGVAMYAASFILTGFAFLTKATGLALAFKVAWLAVSKGAVIAYSAAVAACSFVVGLFTGATWASIAALAAFVVGAALAGAAVYLIFENLDELMTFMSAWIPVLESFGAVAMRVFGGMGDAIVAGDWLLAMRILWAGIKVVWTEGVNWIRDAWFSASYLIMGVWDEITGNISHLITDLGAFIKSTFFVVADAVEDFFVSVLNSIISKINTVVSAIPARFRMGLTEIGLFSGTSAEDRRRRDDRLRANTAAAHIEIDRESTRRERERAAEHAFERERARLENMNAHAELDILNAEAQFARMMREMENISLAPPSGPGPDMEEKAAEKIRSTGTFSASAVFGMLGGQTGSPMERLVTLAEREAQERARQDQIMANAQDRLIHAAMFAVEGIEEVEVQLEEMVDGIERIRMRVD